MYFESLLESMHGVLTVVTWKVSHLFIFHPVQYHEQEL